MAAKGPMHTSSGGTFIALRFLLGLTACFCLWMKEPSVSWFPPVQLAANNLAPYLSYLPRALGLLGGAVFLLWEGIAYRRDKRFLWWVNQVLGLAAAALLIYVAVVLVLAPFVLSWYHSLIAKSERGHIVRRVYVRGRGGFVPLTFQYFAFLLFGSPLVSSPAIPVTIALLCIFSLWLRRRESYPATRLAGINSVLAAMIAWPLLLDMALRLGLAVKK